MARYKIIDSSKGLVLHEITQTAIWRVLQVENALNAAPVLEFAKLEK